MLFKNRKSDFMNDQNLIDVIDAVIFSKEFRRLEDKTQLFSVSRGNHFRNRLTHTMEVLAISKKIVRELKYIISQNDNYKDQNINEDLVEAIALSHDLGHTPFGHIGERTLNEILSRKDSLGGIIVNSNVKMPTISFKHNINSGKILINNFRGINYKVIDGAIKHTFVFYKNYSDNGLLKILSNTDFEKEIKKVTQYMQYWKILYPITIEGQIVSIADEIAQRCADLDDTYRSRYLNKLKNLIDYEKLNLEIKTFEENQYDIIISKIKFVLINGIKSSFETILKNNDDLVFNELINTNIINYYGEKITFDHEETKNRDKNAFKKFKENSESIRKQLVKEIKSRKKCQITDYENANRLDYDLSKIIDVVLKNNDVRVSDSKSKQIIRQLFKAYYNNYQQLGNKEIVHFCQDVKDYLLKNKYKILKKMVKEIDEYNFSSQNKISFEGIYFYNAGGQIELVNFFKRIDQLKIHGSKNEEWLDFQNIDMLIEFIKNNHHKCNVINNIFNIFLSHIANYIASMTDSYAITKYQELYGIKK